MLQAVVMKERSLFCNWISAARSVLLYRGQVRAALPWSPMLLSLVVGQLGSVLAPAQDFAGQKTQRCRRKASQRGGGLIQA